MTKKCIGFLFGILLLGIPFEYHRFHIFRPLARSFLHKFEALAPFALTIPKYFEKHIHFYVSDVLIILTLCLIGYSMRPRLKELTFNTSSRFLTLLWGAALCSLIFSAFSRYYFQYFNLLNLAIIFFGFHAARLFFQDRETVIKRLLWGFAIVSAFECFVGIWQFFTQGPLGVFLLGELPLHIDGPHLTVIPLTAETRKLVEIFRLIPEGRDVLLRAYGTFMHPNVFGEYMAISLMVSYFLFTEAKRRLLRTSILVLVIIQIFCLCLSFSRAGMLSWGLGTLIWFGILLSKKARMEKQEKKKLWPLAAITLAALLLSGIILFPHFHARGGFFNHVAFVQNADTTRMTYVSIALNMIKSNPLLGIGYNCFIIAPSEFFLADPEMMRTWAHNVYLLLGSETGLLGLGCFLFFIYSILHPCLKHSFTPLSAALLAIFVGFLFVGLFDFYFLVVQAGKLMFFLFSGIFAAQLATKAKVFPLSSQA